MMETLINDMMDLAKMQNNRFQLHPEYFNFLQTIQNSFQIMLYSAV